MVRTRGGRRTSKSPSPRRRKNAKKAAAPNTGNGAPRQHDLSYLAARADALGARLRAAAANVTAAPPPAASASPSGPTQFVWTGLDNTNDIPGWVSWWPVAARLYVAGVIFWCWFHYGGPPFKRAVGIVGATGFWLIETLWLNVSATDPTTGHVVLRLPGGARGPCWKASTLAQWWCNALLLPHTLLGTHQAAVGSLCLPLVRLLPASVQARALISYAAGQSTGQTRKCVGFRFADGL